MSRRVLTLVVSLVSILAVFAVYFGIYGRNDRRVNTEIEAASSSVTLTDNADWTAGTNDNTTISADPGSSVTINDKSSIRAVDMSGPVTASREEASAGNVVDGNDSSIWGWVTCDNNHDWWKIDLGSIKNLTKIRLKTTGDAPVNYTVYASTDDSSYTQIYLRAGMFDYFENLDSGNTLGRYVKIDVYNAYVDACVPPNPYLTGVTVGINEMELYATASATHTSATTQLDAGDHDSVTWTTFVPDDSIPANTSINYRFRTSTDAATWGSWTASTASAASIDIETLLGGTDAAKRYLQVETTLANTDGASTPTLDAYTANYDYTDATCSDGIQNGTETGVDCGGTCPACATCSDGIQNQGETGVDCGGPCAACPVVPTCSDGIQNGSETGVDCGGSCPACPVDHCANGVQDADEFGVDCGGISCGDCPTTCPITGFGGCDNNEQNALNICYQNHTPYTQQGARDLLSCIERAQCAAAACEVACGGTGCDVPTDTKVLIANGGETYQLSKDMTIKWVFGSLGKYPDLTKGEKTSFSDRPVKVLLSTDSGAHYDKLLEVLIPRGTSGVASSALLNYYAGSQLQPYSAAHYYSTQDARVNGYYSFTLTLPNVDTLATTHARIKLEPIANGGCCEAITLDTSDADFTLIPGSVLPPICPGPNCPCIGDDCKCTDDTCVCIGSDCECSDPDVCQICHDPDNCEPCTGEACKPCVGDDCRCLDGSCECIGPDCDCRVLDTCHICTGPDCEPCVDEACTPCTSIWCKIFPPGETGNIFTKIAGSIALGLAGLLALVATLLSNSVGVLTMVTPNQMLGLFLKGREKKHQPGTVYDKATGIPIPLAIILLFRSRDKKLISQTTSDKNGRFALETPMGEEYYIEIKKPGFALDTDETIAEKGSLAFDDNYFGGNFRPQTGEIFTTNIPLRETSDSLQYIRTASLVEKIGKILRVINAPLMVLGFGVTVYSLIHSKITFNYVIFSLYLIFFVYLLIKYLKSSRATGLVKDIDSGAGVDLAAIRVRSEISGKLAKTTISNAKGRYHAILPSGYYRVDTTKPGFRQAEKITVRVKSVALPISQEIPMSETAPSPSVAVEPIQTVAPAEPQKQIVPKTQTKNSFTDSSDIIENYETKKNQFGNQDLSQIGVHHLINPE